MLKSKYNGTITFLDKYMEVAIVNDSTYLIEESSI